MNNELLNTRDFDEEIKMLLNNIENIRANVDLYSTIVDEQLLLAPV